MICHFVSALMFPEFLLTVVVTLTSLLMLHMSASVSYVLLPCSPFMANDSEYF